jgi:hypothetical protein
LNPKPATGSSIFSEDFSSSSSLDTEHIAPSEKWGPNTKYFLNPTDPGWTLAGTSVMVVNPLDGDQAMALNEQPNHGVATSNPIAGFISGQTYILTLDHWGDDRPNTTPYEVDIRIDASLIGHLSRTYPTPGPGATESFSFVATAASHTLSFTDVTFVGEASAILDNINIRPVPEPSACAIVLIAAGLLGVAARLRLRPDRCS